MPLHSPKIPSDTVGWDLPSGGDFARYVDTLCAQQARVLQAGQSMVALPDVGRVKNAKNTPAKARAPVAGPASVAVPLVPPIPTTSNRAQQRAAENRAAENRVAAPGSAAQNAIDLEKLKAQWGASASGVAPAAKLVSRFLLVLAVALVGLFLFFSNGSGSLVGVVVFLWVLFGFLRSALTKRGKPSFRKESSRED